MSLTATEYELLRLLTPNAGRVSTHESLIRQLWNGSDSGDPDRVRTFVKQLRRKLGDDPARPAWMLNERGIGYRVPKPEEQRGPCMGDRLGAGPLERATRAVLRPVGPSGSSPTGRARHRGPQSCRRRCR